MDVNELWERALVYIREETVSEVAYNTWIKVIVPVSMSQENIFTIAVPYDVNKTMIEDRYKPLIENSLKEVTHQVVTLETIVSQNPESLQAPPEEKSEKVVHTNTYINPKYTFDKFVVGNSNRYAHAVAVAAAESPGTMYNPLFLYGNSGLGKTHLMHAIGNYILKNHPDMKIVYVSSEKFTNELINSLQNKTMDKFRQRYREVDVLLIDDVQFLEGKESTQEEFFHTFNELYNQNKQIVLTSDRKPKELLTLEERLRTRFECGITTDISVPDYETRIAILKKKAESENATISQDVYGYIADRIKSNIRELEGALLKIISFAGITHRAIDVDLAKDALKSILPEDGIIKITSKKIKEKVCLYYNLTMDELIGKRKTKTLATARQVAMYLCKELTDANYVMIARDFGGRDRTTVMHNVDKIITEMKKEGEIKTAVEAIKQDLQTV